MRESVICVHGPRVLALSSRASFASIAASSSSLSVVVRSQRDPFVLAVPVERDPVGLAVTGLGQLGAQRLERFEPGPAGVGLRQLRLIDDADVVDHQVATREPHAPADDRVRSLSNGERQA